MVKRSFKFTKFISQEWLIRIKILRTHNDSQFALFKVTLQLTIRLVIKTWILWIIVYDNHMYKFNKNTENFLNILQQKFWILNNKGWLQIDPNGQNVLKFFCQPDFKSNFMMNSISRQIFSCLFSLLCKLTNILFAIQNHVTNSRNFYAQNSRQRFLLNKKKRE